jgi:hypothetical protein
VFESGVTGMANEKEPRRSRDRAVALLALGILLTAYARAGALEIEGVAFPAEYRTGDVRLVLQNAALLRYRIFIKAYVAALYLGEDVKTEQVLSDVPKRLEIDYFWAIRAPDFVKATEHGIAANVTRETLRRLRPRIDQINGLYRDVKPGDRYALTYVPGRGTELALNGRPLGSVAGGDFAAALFAIWLGENAIDESLRDDLLAPQ